MLKAAGTFLDHLGRAGLPLGLGIIAGFVAADQRVRFLPTVLEVVVVLFLLSLLSIAVGRAWLGKAEAITVDGARLRKRVVLAIVLALGMVGARLVLFWVEQPSTLTAMSPDQVVAAVTTDAARYRELDEHLDRLARRVSAAVPSSHAVVLSAEEEQLLIELWAAIYDLAFSQDQIRIFYEDYYRFDPSVAQRDLHVRSFLLTFAAELSLYEKASRVTRDLTANPNIEKFINAPHPAHALPEGSLGFFIQELTGARDQTRVSAGRAYLKLLEEGLGRRAEMEAAGLGWLWRRIERHLAVIDEVAPLSRTVLSVKGDIQPLKRAVRRVWYPTLKGVAEWMGDTRVRRIGWYLIPSEQTDEMQAKLQPGDILVSRKNWYISNIGLPGFWPHAILHLGPQAQLDAYFDDPAVHRWVEAELGRPGAFSELLQSKWPSRFIEYRLGEGDAPYVVIEAISEGVVFNTMAHAAGDYLAAVRPRVDKLGKAKAIAEAFAHLGKPYDFDFDFATDHALVCTELVWRAYRPATDKAGLNLDLVKVAGRMTLPANEIVKQIARDHGTPGAQMDFVYFIDAKEREGRTFVSDEAAFLSSHDRTKWDVTLQ